MRKLPCKRIASLDHLAIALVILLSLPFSCRYLHASTPVLSLTEYSADGTNSGTARLSRNVTMSASVAGIKNPTYTWSLQGAGTLSNKGVYTAPAAMPSNGTVTITAKLSSNSAVTGSYSLKLVYNAPATHWTTPAKLVSGKTNSVEIGGLDFTAATIIKVNGSTVPTVFQAPNAVVAQISVAAGSINNLSIVASNPTPGGGSSPTVSVPVTPISVAISSYGTDGVNPTSIPLGQQAQFAAVVSGGNPASSWPITWSLQGPGSISSTGFYQSPASLSSNTTAVVTASLSSNTSIRSTYALSLLQPLPVLNQSLPVEITRVGMNNVTFYGENFTPNTTITVNAHPAKTKFISSTSVSAAVFLPAGTTRSLYVRATNPPPSGGESDAFLLPVGDTNAVRATVGTTAGQAIPGDFIGFSHEWGEAQTFMGTQKSGVNNIYRQLVQNLSNPGTPFLIRIGGGSTDSSVEPTAGLVTAFSDLAKAMPVKFALGINLGSNSVKLAEDQASFFTANMPTGSLAAVEIGNEVDNYPQAGLRPSTYDFNDYLSDFNTWDAGVTPHLPAGVKIMGPNLNTVWHLTQNLPAFETAESKKVSIVSVHYYGGYPNNNLTEDYLLHESTVDHDIAQFQSLASIAHKNGQLFRIGETNSVDLGGRPGLSDSFSAALWATDVMFSEASVGVDGVNWHGMSGCVYCAFTFGTQPQGGVNTFRLQQVNPLYYGLVFFHDATQNSAKLLPVTVTTASHVNIKVWATVDASGTARVAILNKDEAFTGNVSITLPGYGQGTVIRMAAPSFQASAGISYGGQTFDNSFDGNLTGSAMSETYAPTKSVYTIPVQPMSAVMLTLTK